MNAENMRDDADVELVDADMTPAATTDGPSTTPSPAPGRVLRGRIMLGAGIVLLAIVGWVGVKTYQAYHHLSVAKQVISEFRQEFSRHGIDEPATLARLAIQFRGEAEAARSAVDDPLYRMATVVPWLGDNLDAVGQVSRAIDVMAMPLPGVASLAGTLQDGDLLQHGTFNLPLLQQATGALRTLDAAVGDANALVSGIDRAHLIRPVSDAVALFQAELSKVQAVTRSGIRFAQVAAPMLGSEGSRTYLLVFQNLAEPRATGGIFGSYAVISVDNGKLSIRGQGAASRDLPVFDPPIVKVDGATAALYTDLVAQYPNDVNLTPDFPSAGATFAKMYTNSTGREVDGVIAIDPVVAAQLLTGRTAIALPDGAKLTSSNAVKLLLSDLYRKFPTPNEVAARDAYLDAATSAVFSALTAGDNDLAQTVRTTKKMIEQRRVLVWSAHSTEQAQLVNSAVGGRLPTDTMGAPTVGVFINDGSGSKLGYYLDGSTSFTAGQCGPGNNRSLRLAATFTYNAPSTGLSPYVLGYTALKTPYQLQTNVLLFAPTGGSIGSVTVNGKAVPILRGTDHGRNVAVVTIQLMPGQHAAVNAEVVGPDPGDGATVHPRIVTTPGPRQWKSSAPVYAACSP